MYTPTMNDSARRRRLGLVRCVEPAYVRERIIARGFGMLLLLAVLAALAGALR